MSRRIVAALLLLLCPSVSLAQEAPERLLPAGTQVYLRWDGVEAHRAAYAQTALGQTLQGDTGTFFLDLYKQLKENFGPLMTTTQFLQGKSPAHLQDLLADGAEAPLLFE